MTRLLNILLFIACFAFTAVSQDYILFRNGVIVPGKIQQVTDQNTVLRVKKGFMGSKGEDQAFPMDKVYMLHYQSRGNVYVTPEGKRRSGETQTIANDADVIYLVAGKEIPAYGIRIDDGMVYYRETKQTKKAISSERKLLPDEIFMILYSDGSKDILTDITVVEQPEAVEEPVQAEEEVAEPTLKVLFYNVKKGDTLAKIAKMHNVTTDQIVEWNDLPAKTRTNTALQADMQLMIYVPANE